MGGDAAPPGDLDGWISRLERKHFADLTFPEVSRALRALSSTYVERRGRIREGAVLQGSGKRAAFALFYGPLHFVLLQRIASSLRLELRGFRTVVDVGCGTGAAGAAVATAVGAAEVLGIDRHPWALDEAADTYHHFRLRGRTQRADLATPRGLPVPGSLKGATCFVAAFTLNELDDPARDQLLGQLLEQAAKRADVLIVEPLAGSAAPWWGRAAERVVAAGGRADQWRYRAELPATVRKLDRAAGMDHREITARTFFIPASGARPMPGASPAASS
jgi:hypothetical protein